ncbi:MAG: NUDIX hydrolase [Pseudomonadota bacterium]
MSSSAPAPKLSATILLIRDRDEMEVLMVKRHYEIDFASGAFVFPGGKVCEDDASDVWADLFDGDAKGSDRTAQISAIRELFEEAGVLLARSRGARGAGAPLVSAEEVAPLQQYRSAVDAGEKAFSELMEEAGLILAGDCLVHFGHWITPTMMPKRFDTHFYLAGAPDGQVAEQDGRETTEAIWINAHEALELEKRGEATIIFPTRMNLARLGLAKSVPAALEKFASEPVTTVLPEVRRDDPDGPCLIIPFVEGYGQVREPLERVANVAKPKA